MSQPPTEDSRLWAGRVAEGREAEHEQFIEWLNGPEAQEIYRRRRLTEYRVLQAGSLVTVLFKAPHTGDPRIMIDFLRYPGVWPEFWIFERGGVPTADELAAEGNVRVAWTRPED